MAGIVLTLGATLAAWVWFDSDQALRWAEVRAEQLDRLLDHR